MQSALAGSTNKLSRAHCLQKSTFASVEISHERYVGGIRNLMKAPMGNLPAVFARVYTQLVIDVE